MLSWRFFVKRRKKQTLVQHTDGKEVSVLARLTFHKSLLIGRLEKSVLFSHQSVSVLNGLNLEKTFRYNEVSVLSGCPVQPTVPTSLATKNLTIFLFLSETGIAM